MAAFLMIATTSSGLRNGVLAFGTFGLSKAGLSHQFLTAANSITAFRGVRTARIFEPGCKFDHVPILGGEQGIGKSAAFRTLFSDAWFNDKLDNLHSKDSASGLAGNWCIEMAELQGMQRSSIEDTKAFITRQVDKYRPAYGRFEIEQPRQCVFFGTTNDDSYLTDKTGNRRFWPVDCEKADVRWLHENREQLWAEAVTLYQSGTIKLYLDDPAVAAIAKEKQEDKMPDDPWEEAIRDWLAERAGIKNDIITTKMVMAQALHLRGVEQKGRERFIGPILKKLGWEPKRVKIGETPDGKPIRKNCFIKKQGKEP